MNPDRTVSITADAAEAVLAIIREGNPETVVTVEQITAVTDMREIFDLMRPGGPGGFPGGPEGGPGRFPGGPDEMGEVPAGPASADFFMNDTVNSFSGVTDETE